MVKVDFNSLTHTARIYIAGHSGLVGSALLQQLQKEGYENILLKTHAELDLTNQNAVLRFFQTERPEYVFLAAAKVGGIQANINFPADFIRDNLQIQINIIEASYQVGVKKLLFLGSSCIYPKLASQPMKEDSLLTGLLEPTNEYYAIAKIAGIKMCQAYRKQYGFNAISIMPANLYGPGDNFHDLNSHVLAALLRRFHEAKQLNQPSVSIWGSGRARREFLYIDDLASATLFLMNHYNDENIINVGTGEDLSIKELAKLVKDVTGYQGKLQFDSSKPDGMPRKLLDVSRIHEIGWKACMPLRQGVETTYHWFLKNQAREK